MSGGFGFEGDTLRLDGTVLNYTPVPDHPNKVVFQDVDAAKDIGVVDFDEIIVQGDTFVALGTDEAPSRTYSVAGTGNPGSKFFGYLAPGSNFQRAAMQVFDEYGALIAESPGESLETTSGTITFSTGDLGTSEAKVKIGDPIPVDTDTDFRFYGGFIDPSEFGDEQEPNNSLGDEIAVQIDHNHRVAVVATWF